MNFETIALAMARAKVKRLLNPGKWATAPTGFAVTPSVMGIGTIVTDRAKRERDR